MLGIVYPSTSTGAGLCLNDLTTPTKEHTMEWKSVERAGQ